MQGSSLIQDIRQNLTKVEFYLLKKNTEANMNKSLSLHIEFSIKLAFKKNTIEKNIDFY